MVVKILQSSNLLTPSQAYLEQSFHESSVAVHCHNQCLKHSATVQERKGRHEEMKVSQVQRGGEAWL